MGMTIEEQIKGLEYLEKCGIFPFSDTRTGIVFTDECINEAIETMKKYQKIEQAYKKYLNDMVTNIYADEKFIKALREVLEDATN